LAKSVATLRIHNEKQIRMQISRHAPRTICIIDTTCSFSFSLSETRSFLLAPAPSSSAPTLRIAGEESASSLPVLFVGNGPSRLYEDMFKTISPPPPACRGEGSAVRLQLRVRFLPAALLAMLGTALALQCVSKARDWTGHVARCSAFSLLLTAIAGVRMSPYWCNVEVFPPWLVMLCCAVLCCCAVQHPLPCQAKAQARPVVPPLSLGRVPPSCTTRLLVTVRRCQRLFVC
jgi:hypothetical protein